MCCPGPGTSERSEITKPWRSQAKEELDQVTWSRSSRGFNQPHHRMIFESISNFQIRVAQAIQKDLLIAHLQEIKIKVHKFMVPKVLALDGLRSARIDIKI